MSYRSPSAHWSPGRKRNAPRYSGNSKRGRYATQFRRASSRLRASMVGRGSRPGPGMYRRFRGLASYPGSGIETKFLDNTLPATALTAPPSSATWSGMDSYNPATALCFNSMVQGTGASQRDGRKVTSESLLINGVVTIASQTAQGSADTLPIIKVWVVLDTQTNGGTATGLDSENVYTNPTTLPILGMAPLRNMLYTKRYKILKEIVLDIKALPMAISDATMANTVVQEGVHVPFQCFLNLKGMVTNYLSNTGTVTDVVDNGVFILAGTSSASYAPTISYNARLRFRG